MCGFPNSRMITLSPDLSLELLHTNGADSSQRCIDCSTLIAHALAYQNGTVTIETYSQVGESINRCSLRAARE